MSSKQHCVKLNDGHLIPALGFGTYKPKEGSHQHLTVDVYQN
uniref:Aldo-keto reductase family 1, member C13 n=1 Tax=Mus musculus TaxID=10090 RepID=D6RGB1_MOUSE